MAFSHWVCLPPFEYLSQEITVNSDMEFHLKGDLNKIKEQIKKDPCEFLLYNWMGARLLNISKMHVFDESFSGFN